jgi:hypothetical protein
MRTRVTSFIAWAWLLAACKGSESPGTGRETTPRWQLAGTARDRTVHIDAASLTKRADTMRVTARIVQGVDTAMEKIEIACVAQEYRRLDRDQDWQPVKDGLSRVIAESLCAETPPR